MAREVLLEGDALEVVVRDDGHGFARRHWCLGCGDKMTGLALGHFQQKKVNESETHQVKKKSKKKIRQFDILALVILDSFGVRAFSSFSSSSVLAYYPSLESLLQSN